jgi:hypothetical protein
MQQTRPLDLGTILGPDRPFDRNRVLGPAPVADVARRDGTLAASTFNRVKAHSVKGCCGKHDEFRRERDRRRDWN